MVASDGVGGIGGGIEVWLRTRVIDGRRPAMNNIWVVHGPICTTHKASSSLYVVTPVRDCIFDGLSHLIDNIALTLFGIHNGNPLRLISE
jgi:hypothetical protein